jgi:hypothetical protein
MSAVSAHNNIYDRLIALSARYHTSVHIGGPFREGDPAHVNEHNRANVAMIHLRDAGNAAGVTPTIAITLPDSAGVGATGHIADHVLMDAALDVLESVTLPWEV